MRLAIKRSSVDFPHPDGPMRLTNSPGATTRSTSTSASTCRVVPGLKTFPAPVTSTAFAAVMRTASAGGRLRLAAASKAATTPTIARPRAAAPNRAVYILAGSPDACLAYSMISRPTPPRSPVEISATRTPITDAVAASFMAGTMRGTAAGNRSMRIVWRLVAAKLRISSSDVADADSSPRSVPTATGKKARKAPSTATDSHRGHSHPPICRRPPQLTTSGARAIIGTVCDTTR